MTIAGGVAGTGRLLVVGLSHKTAPIEDREKAALDDRLARPVLRALGGHPAVSEAVVLSTCNRTELYAVVQDLGAGETALKRALREHTSIDTGRLECALYTLHEEKVAAHLFRVASGLDSMVVGESEIQGQVRAAAELAAEERLLGPLLAGIYRHALAAGKRVRRETRIGAGTISVSSVAVELARQALDGRHREAQRAGGIIREELSHFRKWHRAAATAPAVRALWARAEAIRQSELAEIEQRSGSLSPEARRQLDAVTRSLVKKLFHEPTLRLRALDNRDDGLRHLESLRYLFGLAEAQVGLPEVAPIDSTPVAADSRPAHAKPFTPKVSRRL